MKRRVLLSALTIGLIASASTVWAAHHGSHHAAAHVGHSGSHAFHAHQPSMHMHKPSGTAHKPGAIGHMPGNTGHKPSGPVHKPGGSVHTPSGEHHTASTHMNPMKGNVNHGFNGISGMGNAGYAFNHHPTSRVHHRHHSMYPMNNSLYHRRGGSSYGGYGYYGGLMGNLAKRNNSVDPQQQVAVDLQRLNQEMRERAT